MHPLRKLLVLGLNETLARGLVTLDPADVRHAHALVRLADRDGIVAWRDIGFGELRLTVWWDLDMARHPQAEDERFVTSLPLAARHRYRDFLGAAVSGWVERQTEPYLQGRDNRGLFDTYARRCAREILAGIVEPVPAGFAASGPLSL